MLYFQQSAVVAKGITVQQEDHIFDLLPYAY